MTNPLQITQIFSELDGSTTVCFTFTKTLKDTGSVSIQVLKSAVNIRDNQTIDKGIYTYLFESGWLDN